VFAQKYDTPVIGIDLGTTYSCVGIFRNGKVEIIPNELGNRITPSVVSFTDGKVLVGEAAKNNAHFNPINTFYDVKRLIGRKYSEVKIMDAKLFSYSLAKVDGKAYVKSTDGGQEKTYSPEEISALILKKMKSIAEKYLNTPVKHAVITVPAYFNDAQRTATKDAGGIAGLNVLRVLNEPTAASMAYGLDKKQEKDILVYDLGGGTFDVSLLTIDNGTFQVRATNGDVHLGGEDFDGKIVDYFAKKIQKKHKVDVRENKRAFQKLKQAVEKAKRILSTDLETVIDIDPLFDNVHFKEKLSRAKFEELNKDLFLRTLKPIAQVIADAKVDKADIDEIIMVGGSTRIPKIRKLVSEFFDGRELNLNINPDEAIAYGAAVQAGILDDSAGTKDLIIIDVTPLSLGIETYGGVMAKIIKKNDPIPTKKHDIFTTTDDYQTTLVIPIYEGERSMTKFNRLLGELELNNIPPARKGVPEIKVSFELDKNGILNVTVEDEKHNNRKQITIRKGSLSQKEIEKMTKDAKDHEEEDEQFRNTVQVRARLESYCDHLSVQISKSTFVKRSKSKLRKDLEKYLVDTKKFVRESKEIPKVSTLLTKLSKLKKLADPLFRQVYGRNDQFDVQLPADFEEEEEEQKVEEDESTKAEDMPIPDPDDKKKEDKKDEKKETKVGEETISVTTEKKKDEL